MSADIRYIQMLEVVGLAIERPTGRTPDKTRFHVFQRDELVMSFRRLPDAQRLFVKLREESEWRPRGSEMTTAEKLELERQILDRMAYREYWSQPHKFRDGVATGVVGDAAWLSAGPAEPGSWEGSGVRLAAQP
jgi:hypothetical protein